MDDKAKYLKAAETYRIARDRIVEIAQSLITSSDDIERAMGQALLKYPERVNLIGLPSYSGVPLEATLSPAAEFNVTGWARAVEVADAIVALVEKRLACSSHYERVPHSERSGIASPRDLMDSVL